MKRDVWLMGLVMMWEGLIRFDQLDVFAAALYLKQLTTLILL